MNPRPALRQLFWSAATLLSHYRRRPAQTVFLLAGLVTGVALWSAVQIINSHARASYAGAEDVLGARATHWINAADGGGITPAAYIDLRLAGFQQVYPVIEDTVVLDTGRRLDLIATDLLALPGGDAPGNLAGAGGWLALIQPPHEAWYPAELAASLGVTGGARLALADGTRLPPAVIQQREQQGRRIFMDIGAALGLLQRQTFSYLAVGEISDAGAADLETRLPAGLRLERNRQHLDLSRLTDSFHTQLTAMSLLSFAVGLFIVFNAVRYALITRAGTFYTLRELGVSGRTLSLAIVAETLLWSLAGSTLGLLLGYSVGHALLPPVAATLESLYGAEVGADLLLRPRSWLVAFSLTLAGLVLALAWPLWQQGRLPVLAGRALDRGWLRDAAARRRLAWLSPALLAAAALVYTQSVSLEAGFVVLGLVIFAAAFLLPIVLAGGLHLARVLLAGGRWQRRWALQDGFAQLPALRVAMMALLLALAANVGVDTLVGSFRSALDGWLDQRLDADIYLRRDALTREILGLDEKPPWLAASHQRTGLSLRWRDHPTQVTGLEPAAPDSHALPLAASSPALQAWYREGAAGNAIIANEQVRHLAGVRLGDHIALPTPQGPVAFEVVAFLHDYGNPRYRFYLPRRQVEALWAGAAPQGLSLWLAQAPDAGERAQAFLQAAGVARGEWTDRGTIRDISLHIFERTFAITAAMNSLTLGVAGLALFTALLSIHRQRLPAYAHWRALGPGYGEITGVLALPLAVTVAITWLAALPLGLLLSWFLIHELNVRAFGWTMPLQWQWEPVAQLAALVLVIPAAALLLALYQVRQRLPGALQRLGETA